MVVSSRRVAVAKHIEPGAAPSAANCRDGPAPVAAPRTLVTLQSVTLTDIRAELDDPGDSLAAPRRRIPGRDAGRKISVLIGVTILLAAIHVSYQYLIAPSYSYMKLVYESPDVPVYTAMLALLLIIALILPVRLNRAADFLLWVIYLLVVVPSLTISHLAGTLSAMNQLMLGCIVTVTFGGVILASRLPTGWLTAHIRPLPPTVFWGIVIALTAITYGMLAASGQLRLQLPGLTDVYTVRGNFAESAGGNRILGYLMPAQAAVINPVFIAAGIRRRNLLLFTGGIVAELLLYGAGGHKTVLFSIPAILLAAVLYGRGRRPSGALFAWAAAAVIGVSAIIDEIARTPWLTSLFTRRVIDMPGLLTGAWISTFTDRPKAHFAYSFLSPFLPYHYELTPPYLVSADFFNNPMMNANANLFANGFANAGWLGIAIEAAALAVVVVLANAAAHRTPLIVAVILLASPSVALVNGSVFTSLLSHGVLPAIAVLLLAPPSVWTSPAAIVSRTGPSGRSAEPTESSESPTRVVVRA